MITKEELESIGFDWIGWNYILHENGYKKSIKRLWIHITEVPFRDHTVYRIEASSTECGPKTIVVHSIRLCDIEELTTLIKQLNLNE